jgi:hypothetical protein
VPAPQTFQNHARFVPLYHYVTFPLALLATGYWLAQVVRTPTADHVFLFVVALCTVLAAYWARAFATRLQDRVIRLEERLRLERLLSERLHPKIGELTVDQLVALRFASDEELEELTGRVLRENITARKAIKSLVRSWRADHARV